MSSDLPINVAFTLHQGSPVTSLDFHPSQHTLLLVGCENGEITLWEAGTREKKCLNPFTIWIPECCSLGVFLPVAKDAPFSVSRVVWSPDGSFCGAAYSRHLIHLYAYVEPTDLRQYMEIDAHVGAVNDITFANPGKQPCVVTCGDDKFIKVWDLVTGKKLFTFDGHKAPVYSICPHQKENIQFIMSTAVDGKIKDWLYGEVRSRVDYNAPGHSCTAMLYSADGTRLFLCGTRTDGDSFLVEWDESKGAIRRTYGGFGTKSTGKPTRVVQFDTTRNHFLAAGEDSQIKFWDMDNFNLLKSTNAEGGLSPFPFLRFNKEGNLLAVTTADNGIKILANDSGMRSLRTVEVPHFEALRFSTDEATTKNGDVFMARSMTKWKVAEVVDRDQCRTVTMLDSVDCSNKVVGLLYMHSGEGMLAVGSNGILTVWKWVPDEHNPGGMELRSWCPNSGLRMTNDTSGVNLEVAVPCIALSAGDSYVMSSIGSAISFFDMVTFKLRKRFLSLPAAPTCMAFHPRNNNIIAVGMEDSIIRVFDFRVKKVISKLAGHQKRITGLAFSKRLNILVSCGADAQLCLWRTDTWNKKRSFALHLLPSKAPGNCIRVQFHSDQVHFLVVHESQLVVYDAQKMTSHLWLLRYCIAISGPISCATYSCNGELVFATFCDGHIGMFDANSLRLRCVIAPSAYLCNRIQHIHPVVVAAHPQKPNQFSIILTDGSLKVIEPLESEGKWGMSPPADMEYLWLRKPNEVTDEEYTKFYYSLIMDCGDEEPLSWIHFTYEGVIKLKAILFVPPDSYYNSNKANMKLYVKWGFISCILDEFDGLMPKYLNFLMGLVDSDTLRPKENIQEHSSILVRKALEMIHKLADEDPEESIDNNMKDIEESSGVIEKKGQYAKFWKEFGKSIKLGIIEDATNRNWLAKLVRFETTKSDGKLTSLEKYISRMKPSQTDVFYITGTSKKQLEKSRFLERITKNNFEVIFFTDPGDEDLLQYLLMDYEDKKFQDVCADGLIIRKGSRDKELEESFMELTKWWKDTLASENVVDVKLSYRLVESPCVVVMSKYGSGVLEINPRHPVIKELRERVSLDPEDEMVKQNAQLMYETAFVETTGLSLKNPKDFATRIYSLVKSSLEISPDAVVEDDVEDGESESSSEETEFSPKTEEAAEENANTSSWLV